MGLSIRMGSLPGGRKTCMIGMNGDYAVVGVDDDFASALHTAAGLANKLQGALDAHPGLKAVVPPQALIALQAASMGVKAGLTADQLAQQYGPAIAQTAKKLFSWL